MEELSNSQIMAGKLANMLKSIDEPNELSTTYRLIKERQFTDCLKAFLGVDAYFDPLPRAGFTDDYIYELVKRASEADPLFYSYLERQDELSAEEEIYVKLRIKYFKARVKECIKYYTDLKSQD